MPMFGSTSQNPEQSESSAQNPQIMQNIYNNLFKLSPEQENQLELVF